MQAGQTELRGWRRRFDRWNTEGLSVVSRWWWGGAEPREGRESGVCVRLLSCGCGHAAKNSPRPERTRGVGVVFRGRCSVRDLFSEDCLGGHDATGFAEHVIEDADQQFERLL